VSYTSDGLGVEPIYILQVVKVDYGNEWQPLAEYPMKGNDGIGLRLVRIKKK